ncbi:MAG TPA: hypothetical protein VN837_02255, partial [Chloroflexota bacterium]|nr:hypothetical protein [Chloroflexota bacterium]
NGWSTRRQKWIDVLLDVSSGNDANSKGVGAWRRSGFVIPLIEEAPRSRQPLADEAYQLLNLLLIASRTITIASESHKVLPVERQKHGT